MGVRIEYLDRRYMHDNLNSRLKPVKHVSGDLELKGVLDDSNQTLDFVSGQFASSVFCEG